MFRESGHVSKRVKDFYERPLETRSVAVLFRSVREGSSSLGSLQTSRETEPRSVTELRTKAPAHFFYDCKRRRKVRKEKEGRMWQLTEFHVFLLRR